MIQSHLHRSRMVLTIVSIVPADDMTTQSSGKAFKCCNWLFNIFSVASDGPFLRSRTRFRSVSGSAFSQMPRKGTSILLAQFAI